jgi:NAD(P)-dependent dehydrogenase (short-subunit alcohol dehydrogenase family)
VLIVANPGFVVAVQAWSRGIVSRWIDAADVAPLVVFLASDEARMVSGTSFAATAGDSANVTA